MNIKLHAPTNELRAVLVQLLRDGVPGHFDPLFPGIPVYGDDEPEEIIAPYLSVDLSDDPQPWGRTCLWKHRLVIRLVQPVAIPTDDLVSLDYNSAAAESYEKNLEDLIRGQWPKAGISYNENDRTTYRNLSDWLLMVAEDQNVPLQFLDVAQIHRVDCAEGGPPARAKIPLTNEMELEFDFVLVAVLQDSDL